MCVIASIDAGLVFNVNNFVYVDLSILCAFDRHTEHDPVERYDRGQGTGVHLHVYIGTSF